MKKQLLFLLILLSAVGSAQVVNIPDEALKNLLILEIEPDSDAYYWAKDINGDNIYIDTNNDNEIQISEALLVYELTIADCFAESLEGLEYFSNIETLSIYNVGVSSLDVPEMPNLKHIIYEDYGGDNPLHYDFSGLTGLESFYCFNSDNMESIDFTGNINLKTIVIKFSFSDSLEILGLDNNDMPLLEKIDIGHGYIIMPLGYLPALTDAIFESARTPVLDLSGCPALTNLNLHLLDMPEAYINLKNGNSEYENFDVSIGWPVCYICIDEGEEANFENNPGQVVYFSTYCSFFPEENHNTIAGNLTFDSNNDGCDSGDNFNGLVKVNITNNEETETLFTNITGNYQLYPGAGDYTITPELENNWFTISPESADITFAEANSTTFEQNFCITANGIHPDAEIVVSGWGAQPGFDTGYTITYKNKGNQTLSGDITLTYDDSVLDYIEATPAEVTSATGTLTWSYSDLQPFESRSIQVTMNLNGPMETPAVNIDDVLPFAVSITPTTSDETPADNTFNLNQAVVGSYDPNDITCLEGESIIPELIGEYLHYNINFENTGNSPATFIVIINEINEAQFDVGSIQLLTSSHDVETKIIGSRLEFRFEDIGLAANGGKGNVVYKIKTNNTLQVNDDVAQQANIYFDYNWPIQTNEAVTTFETLSSGIHTKDNSIKLYPNPATSIVTITAATEIELVEMYDMQGRLLQVTQTSTLDITQRQLGIYFVKVTTEKGSNVQKLVKE